MKKGCASVVGNISLPTDLKKQNTVLKSVQTKQFHDSHNYVRIKNIRYIGKGDVYNMEVKDHHNFSVEGGLIVHNCIDATRYAFEDDMKRPSVSILK
ncbi:hypothetical protein ES017_06155 [Anoxybacillus sp. EFIL]|nr:hypothetical protein [Anoxybacillus sp. EFIL]